MARGPYVKLSPHQIPYRLKLQLSIAHLQQHLFESMQLLQHNIQSNSTRRKHIKNQFFY